MQGIKGLTNGGGGGGGTDWRWPCDAREESRAPAQPCIPPHASEGCTGSQEGAKSTRARSEHQVSPPAIANTASFKAEPVVLGHTSSPSATRVQREHAVSPLAPRTPLQPAARVKRDRDDNSSSRSPAVYHEDCASSSVGGRASKRAWQSPESPQHGTYSAAQAHVSAAFAYGGSAQAGNAAAQPQRFLGRQFILRKLPRYNMQNSAQFVGRLVLAQHSKRCTHCHTRFDLDSDMYYYTEKEPRDGRWEAMEKFCDDCTAQRLGGLGYKTPVPFASGLLSRADMKGLLPAYNEHVGMRLTAQRVWNAPHTKKCTDCCGGFGEANGQYAWTPEQRPLHGPWEEVLRLLHGQALGWKVLRVLV